MQGPHDSGGGGQLLDSQHGRRGCGREMKYSSRGGESSTCRRSRLTSVNEQDCSNVSTKQAVGRRAHPGSPVHEEEGRGGLQRPGRRRKRDLAPLRFHLPLWKGAANCSRADGALVSPGKTGSPQRCRSQLETSVLTSAWHRGGVGGVFHHRAPDAGEDGMNILSSR